MAERTFKPRECSVQKISEIESFLHGGDGELSFPSEYETPANVPEYVIQDIITWVNETKIRTSKAFMQSLLREGFLKLVIQR